MTVGGAMSGYCAIGKIALATKPAITMMIAMTPASTGRSMKNFENMSVGRGGGYRLRVRLLFRLRDNGDAGIQLHQVVEDHGVAVLESLADDPVLADPITDFNITLHGLAIGTDGPHEATLRSLQHGGLRNCDDLLRSGIESHCCELAGEN